MNNFLKTLFLTTFFIQGNYIKYSYTSTYAPGEDFNMYNEDQVRTLVQVVFGHNKKNTPFLETSNIPVKKFMEHTRALIENVNGEELYKLFYNPDWEIWSKLYNNITGQTASGIKIVELLDQTKSAILLAYKGAKVDAQNANLYIISLIDEAILNLFSGCWGIDNKPAEQRLQEKLLGILDRTLNSRIAYEKQFEHDTEQFNFNKYKKDNPPKIFIDHLKALEQRWKFVACHPTSARQPIGNVEEMFLVSPKRTITFYTHKCYSTDYDADGNFTGYGANIFSGLVADLIIELLAFSEELPRKFIRKMQVDNLNQDQKERAFMAIKKNCLLSETDKIHLIHILGFLSLNENY